MKKIIAISSIVVAVILGFLGFGYYKYFYIPPLPAPAGAKTVSYTFEYKGEKYNLNETVYQSIDDYYGKRSKGIFDGFETNSIEKYLTLDQKTTETDEVVANIKKLAGQHSLNEDQTLELAVSFIQAIPYDEARAKTDLTHPRYPYEVLYENTGICSDKTLLTVSVLRELGYGAGVFMWDKEQHMAAAVACPNEHSNYGTGYCIVETTAAGAKIGVVPDLDSGTLKAIGRASLSNYKEESQQATSLGTGQLYAQKTGKVYQGILTRLNIENEISQIEQYLKGQKAKINSEEQQLENLKKQLDANYAAQNYKTYNSLVPGYNNLVAQVKKDIAEYNAKVQRYNFLIKQ
jgi:hypothetical protein